MNRKREDCVNYAHKQHVSSDFKPIYNVFSSYRKEVQLANLRKIKDMCTLSYLSNGFRHACIMHGDWKIEMLLICVSFKNGGWCSIMLHITIHKDNKLLTRPVNNYTIYWKSDILRNKQSKVNTANADGSMLVFGVIVHVSYYGTNNTKAESIFELMQIFIEM